MKEQTQLKLTGDLALATILGGLLRRSRFPQIVADVIDRLVHEVPGQRRVGVEVEVILLDETLLFLANFESSEL